MVTDDEVNLKYLCGYLNSKIFFWQFKNIGISMGSGYEFKVAYVKDIEVIDLDFENKSKISILVDEIIDYRKKGEDLKAEKLESIINDIIYKAYGLNEEEQLIIEEYNL